MGSFSFLYSIWFSVTGTIQQVDFHRNTKINGIKANSSRIPNYYFIIFTLQGSFSKSVNWWWWYKCRLVKDCFRTATMQAMADRKLANIDKIYK